MTTSALHYGLVPLDVLRTLSGLEFFQGMAAGDYPLPPICQTLGFGIVQLEPGRVVFSSQPEFRHYNPLGTIHGGYIATLLDSAMACSVHSLLKAGQGHTTLELKVNFIRAVVPETGLVFAQGEVINLGQRVGVAAGRLVDAAGKLYAHSTTTCLLLTL